MDGEGAGGAVTEGEGGKNGLLLRFFKRRKTLGENIIYIEWHSQDTSLRLDFTTCMHCRKAPLLDSARGNKGGEGAALVDGKGLDGTTCQAHLYIL